MSVQPISTCLDGIIGLSRSACECREFPFDAETSLSGLYLDALPGLTLKAFDSLEDCDEGNVWNILNISRSDAIQAFFADLPATLIQTRYDYYQDPWRGVVGNAKFNADKNITGAYAGLLLYPLPIRAGLMKLKRVGLIFNQTTTINIHVYSSSSPQTPIESYLNVPTTANLLTWYDLNIPLELPMFDDGYDHVEYFIAYENTGGFKPKNNGLVSGCGCNYYYNRSKPQWKFNSSNRWRNFLMVSGASGSSAQAVFQTNSCAAQGNGLVLDIDFNCKTQQFICDGFNFESDANSQVMAYATWFKSGAILIERILGSPNINRYTMMDRERLYGLRNNYSKEYVNRLNYLAMTMNVTDSGCYICKKNINVQGIQATWTDEYINRDQDLNYAMP